jgi:murein L,D-transpeptidase YcbB/YkuD
MVAVFGLGTGGRNVYLVVTVPAAHDAARASQGDSIRQPEKPGRAAHTDLGRRRANMTAKKLRRYSAAAISVATGIAFCVVVPAAAAQDPISNVLEQFGGTEWSDGFDSASVGANDVRTSTPTMSPQIVASLQNAIGRYSEIAARGGWPVVPAKYVLRVGVSDPSVAILRKRLTVSGDLPPAPGTETSYDSYVEAAVKRFQARHGIPADGIVGKTTYEALNVSAPVRLNQLATNLTRLKMLTTKLPDRFVMVNVPAASIEAVENGSVASRHTAIVGKFDRQTPLLNSKIYEINFNPFWTVPKSIIKRDLIPLMQKQPDYLAEQRIRIYTYSGEELAPEAIDWQTDEAVKYMFRQDPGDFNSLGNVRINFNNSHQVYMHDTPNKGLFREETRFFSSGCVRVQNVRDLIAWLAEGETSNAQLGSYYQTGERYDLKLSNPVPVFFSYITAWAVTDGVVQFRNDIYKLDGLEDYSPAVATQQL